MEYLLNDTTTYSERIKGCWRWCICSRYKGVVPHRLAIVVAVFHQHANLHDASKRPTSLDRVQLKTRISQLSEEVIGYDEKS